MTIASLCHKIKTLGGLRGNLRLNGYGELATYDELGAKRDDFMKALRGEYDKALSERVVGRMYPDGIWLIASPIWDDDELVTFIWAVQDDYAVTVMRDEVRFTQIEKNLVAYSIFKFLEDEGFILEEDKE